MDPTIAAILESMKEQQKQFIETLMNVRKEEPAAQLASSPPKFESFDKTNESWNQYLLRLVQHLELHNVTNPEKRRAFLLSCLDPDTFSLLQNLFGAEKVTEKSFEELTSKLSAHFEDTIHVQAARYSFYQCKMESHQTYADWVAVLRGIARNCQFTCKSNECNHRSFVDEQIRDVVILNTPHPEVRRQCLLEPNISLDDVLKKAMLYTKTVETDRLLTSHSSVNKMSFQKNKSRQNKSASAQLSRKTWKRCEKCFTDHLPSNCPYKSYTCNKCKKMGHLQSVCKSKSINVSTEQSSQIKEIAVAEQVGNVFTCSDESASFEGEDFSSTICERIGKQIWVKVEVLGKELMFQWDTGSTCSMVGIDGYKKLGSPKCEPASNVLKAYGGKRLDVIGKCVLDVKVGSKVQQKMNLIVVNEKGSNLFGLDWSDAFGMTTCGTSALHIVGEENLASNVYQKSANFAEKLSGPLENLRQKYSEVFDDDLGKCTKTQASIHVRENTKPIFHNFRPIPFAVRKKVEDELSRLVDMGVLQKIDYSEWATPIVVVNKPNGKVRICGDFKPLNRHIQVDQHPIPTLDILMDKLQGGKFYSKIDLADAYLQIELDDEAKKLCVINTPFGLYQYNRMCFGLASSPAQFQRLMDTLIAGLPGVAAYLDDLIITGATEKEHWENMELLIQKLSEYGLRIKLEKSAFFQNSVEYLGFIIDKDGKRPSKLSVEAVKKLKIPENVTEVQAFLGKINYYRCFIKNLAELANPLYMLLKKDCEFKWTSDCESAFQKLKNEIINATKLSHYDSSKPLILATDASNKGIGAVLMQKHNGIEKPIAHASKTLTETQRRYSQIEREALAIIFGVKKFHQFLFGRKFCLVTDHKPLVSIFSPDKHFPVLTAQRLQRYAIILMAYQFEIQFKPTKDHGNADGLSRLTTQTDAEFDKFEQRENTEILCNIGEATDGLPLTHAQIQDETLKDSVLKSVLLFTRRGSWPNFSRLSADLIPFYNQKKSLCIVDDMLLLQRHGSTRVVIPSILRDEVLHLLHEGHWGSTRIKQMARRYVWWPKVNDDVENLVRNCKICRLSAKAPPADFKPWPKPTKAWERLHLDFAGPFLGKMWLIVVDAFSKYPYVVMLNVGQTTADHTIDALQQIFAMEGLPDTIVTDNGTQFVSSVFENFCIKFNIKHLTSPAFHPASNGEAERFVQTFKRGVEKNVKGKNSLVAAVRFVLSTYRCSPHPCIDWRSPAEVLHGRQPKNLLSLFLPRNNANENVVKCETECNNFKPKHNVGDLVYARNYASGPKWYEGIITKNVGSMLYTVRTDRGLWRRHQNQLQPRFLDLKNDCNISSVPTRVFAGNSSSYDGNVYCDRVNVNPSPKITPVTHRYPTRNRKRPDCYQAGFR